MKNRNTNYNKPKSSPWNDLSLKRVHSTKYILTQMDESPNAKKYAHGLGNTKISNHFHFKATLTILTTNRTEISYCFSPLFYSKAIYINNAIKPLLLLNDSKNKRILFFFYNSLVNINKNKIYFLVLKYTHQTFIYFKIRKF